MGAALPGRRNKTLPLKKPGNRRRGWMSLNEARVMIKRFFLLSIFFLGIGFVQTGAQTNTATAVGPIRVACVGASITAGFGTKDHAKESYPAQMQIILGTNYEVRNL